jgi:aminoglycoside phosphotransferase
MADAPLLETLPVWFRRLLLGGLWHDVTSGYSGDTVFRIEWTERPPCYLKVASQPERREELRAEHERLAWLRRRLPVPKVEAFDADEAHSYLLISQVPGTMACDAIWEQDISTLVRLLAEGLRLIHAVDIAACPFDERLERKLTLAEQRVRAGLVDESDFDAERLGIRASDLFTQLVASRPVAEDLVFTHGDYCLPNVFIERQGLSTRIGGFVDWGRAGVADRYTDLALAVRSLAYNFGTGHESLLWDACGLDAPDLAKIEFYQLLDEFF